MEDNRRMIIGQTAIADKRAIQGGGAMSMDRDSYAASFLADNTGVYTNYANGMCHDVLLRDVRFCEKFNTL